MKFLLIAFVVGMAAAEVSVTTDEVKKFSEKVIKFNWENNSLYSFQSVDLILI